MRAATRRAAGLDAAGWTSDLRNEVEGFFDTLASEWHLRTSPQRTAVVIDALVRGLDPLDVPRGMAIGSAAALAPIQLIAEHFATVVAVDLSLEMLGGRRSDPPVGFAPTGLSSR